MIPPGTAVVRSRWLSLLLPFSVLTAAGPTVEFAVATPQAVAEIYRISPEGIHELMGSMTLVQDRDQLVIDIEVRGLTPGGHAMHVHQEGSCEPAADEMVMKAGHAAGSHYIRSDGDTEDGTVRRPHGDLPELYSDESGLAVNKIRSYDLKLSEIRGRAVMIHAYPEQPRDLSLPRGGGPRVACGIIPR